MRRVVVLVASASVGACSFLVSTGDLSGGGAEPDSASDAPADALVDASAPDGSADGAVDPRLVAWWTFDETSGTVAHDRTGHGHDAVLASGATFGADGQSGGCLVLSEPAFASVVDLGGTAFPRSGTLSLWFKTGFPAADPLGRGIFDDYDESRAHLFIRHAPQSSECQFALQPVQPSYAYGSSFVPAQAVWTHVVLTWDEVAQVAASYADGAQVSLRPYVLPFAPTGQQVRFGVGFIGSIDEAKLWNQALPPVEAAALR